MNVAHHKFTAEIPCPGGGTGRLGFSRRYFAEEFAAENGPGQVRRSTPEDIGHYRLDAMAADLCRVVHDTISLHADTLGLLDYATVAGCLVQVSAAVESALRNLPPLPPPRVKLTNSERARRGGLSRSPAKVAASRMNLPRNI